MVSFWPFKSGDTDAASFEKVLSQLSSKITRAAAQNDGFRQKQRRYKVLWTLYTTFAYIVVVALLLLVVGWQRWNAAEYSAVAGSPVLIYAVRTALDAYYNYRIANSQNHLNDLNKQREAAIEKLKAATKYNSTQQLLDKYGGSPGRRQPSPQPPRKRKLEGLSGKPDTPQGPRTGFAPPPTANIPRPQNGPVTPHGTPGARIASGKALSPVTLQPGVEPTEEFAPNAFSLPSRPAIPRVQSTQYAAESPKWYDRILDVVLGEDETQAKNRIALICRECRLVNGQAPPGARTPEEIGRWRCSSCHAWNGVESEEKRMLKQIAGDPQSPASPSAPTSAVSESPRETESDDRRHSAGSKNKAGSGRTEEEHDQDTESDDMGGELNTPPAGLTRSKARQRKRG